MSAVANKPSTASTDNELDAYDALPYVETEPPAGNRCCRRTQRPETAGMARKDLRELLVSNFTFFRLHVLYFLMLSIVGGLIMYAIERHAGSSGLAVVDALFCATSAASETGLATIDLNKLTTGSQVVIMLLALLGGQVLMSAVPVLLRRRYFMRAATARIADEAERRRVLEQETVEYRALSWVLTIIVCYWVVLVSSSFLIMGLYLQFVPSARALCDAAGVNPWWWSLFHTITGANNAGFGLFADNLMSFSQHPVILLVITVDILAGNVAYPVLFRYIVFRLHRHYRHREPALKMLLDRPRRHFTHMFRSRPTAALAATIVAFTLLEFFLFLALDYNVPAFAIYSGPTRALLGWFQAVSTRTAGFNAINLADVAPAMQVLYALMMYIAAVPQLITVRRSAEQGEGVHDHQLGEHEQEDAEHASTYSGSFSGMKGDYGAGSALRPTAELAGQAVELDREGRAWDRRGLESVYDREYSAAKGGIPPAASKAHTDDSPPRPATVAQVQLRAAPAARGVSPARRTSLGLARPVPQPAIREEEKSNSIDVTILRDDSGAKSSAPSSPPHTPVPNRGTVTVDVPSPLRTPAPSLQQRATGVTFDDATKADVDMVFSAGSASEARLRRLRRSSAGGESTLEMRVDTAPALPTEQDSLLALGTLTRARLFISRDLPLLFLALLVVCIAEDARIRDTSPTAAAINVWSIFFELVSGFGTVGLSLGYTGISSSLSTVFCDFSKFVVMGIMLAGRHRGLPQSVDPSVYLPSLLNRKAPPRKAGTASSFMGVLTTPALVRVGSLTLRRGLWPGDDEDAAAQQQQQQQPRRPRIPAFASTGPALLTPSANGAHAVQQLKRRRSVPIIPDVQVLAALGGTSIGGGAGSDSGSGRGEGTARTAGHQMAQQDAHGSVVTATGLPAAPLPAAPSSAPHGHGVYDAYAQRRQQHLQQHHYGADVVTGSVVLRAKELRKSLFSAFEKERRASGSGAGSRGAASKLSTATSVELAPVPVPVPLPLPLPLPVALPAAVPAATAAAPAPAPAPAPLPQPPAPSSADKSVTSAASSPGTLPPASADRATMQTPVTDTSSPDRGAGSSEAAVQPALPAKETTDSTSVAE